jgi:hypothetical protein
MRPDVTPLGMGLVASKMDKLAEQGVVEAF